MKTTVLLTLLISISLMSCKRTKVYTIQTNNIRHTSIAPFANATYTIYEIRNGLKPIYDGQLNNKGNDVFDIKINPKRSYYYSIKTKSNKLSYLNNDNGYLTAYTLGEKEFKIDNNTIIINYVLLSDMVCIINNDSCFDSNDKITIELVYLENLNINNTIENKNVHFYGCNQDRKIDFNLYEGRYAINWSVSRNYSYTEYTDTVSLVYGDTLHYTLNY